MYSEDSNEEIDILSDGEEQSVSATKQSLEAKSNRMTVDSDVGDADPSPFESSENLMDSPKPGPSGINQESENEDVQIDSDDSVEILEVPKKPIPLIVISDSSSDSEIDVVEVKRKVPKSKPKEKKMKSIPEKLEEQKEKIFAVKVEPESGKESPPNKHDFTCSICLGTYQDRAFLDDCFHSFCYTCILQWAKVVHTCPLCKCAFKSVIHDITPDLDYKQEFMDKSSNSTTESVPSASFAIWMDPSQRFRYRTTVTSVGNYIRDWYRQRRYESFSTSFSLPSRRREPRSWGRIYPSSRSRAAVGEERRRSVYRCDLVIKDIKHPPGRVRYRDISVQFFKDNPAVAHRLIPWIMRDLKAILNNNTSNASFILHLVMSLLRRYPMESDEFCDQLQPYLFNNTRQFIRELISFASSPYDMPTYDSLVVYDFPSAMQPVTIHSGSQPLSMLQPHPIIDVESDVLFRDRLLDEMFEESRIGSSPPYSPSSPAYDPSNQQKDRSIHKDQVSDSGDSIIDVTGTASITQESMPCDSSSSESGLHLERSSRKLQKKNQGYLRKELENGDHFKDSNSKFTGRRKGRNETSPEIDVGVPGTYKSYPRENADQCGDNASSKKHLSCSRSPSYRASLTNEHCQDNQSMQQAFYSKSDLLQSRSKFPETYQQSRRSRSKSRDSSRKYAFSPYSQSSQTDSYRSGHYYSKSSLDFSQSSSRTPRKDNFSRRSRSRSGESSIVLNNGRSRLGKWTTVYLPRSSRSRSKESADFNDSESRRPNKTGITRSRSRSRESSNYAGSRRRKSRESKKKHRSKAISSSREASNLQEQSESRSIVDAKIQGCNVSRSASRESSCHSASSESRVSKNRRRRSSRSRLPRSRSYKSKSPVSRSHKSRSPGSRSYKSRSPGSRSPGSRSYKSRSPGSRSHKSRSPGSRSYKSRSPGSRSPGSRSYKSRSPGSRSYRSRSKDTGTRNSKSKNSMRSKFSGSSMSRSQDSTQVSELRSENAEENYQSRIGRPRSREASNFCNKPRSDSTDGSDKYHPKSTTKKAHRRVYYQEDSKSKKVSLSETSKTLSKAESRSDSEEKASELFTCRKLSKEVLACREHHRNDGRKTGDVLQESSPKLPVVASSKSEENTVDGDGTAVVQVTLPEEDKDLQVSKVDDISHIEATCEKESHPNKSTCSVGDGSVLNQCLGSEGVCRSILAKLDIGGISRWNTKEEMKEGSNIDIIENSNCIKDIVGYDKQSSKDFEIKHPNTLHTETVRTRSPEFNPVKGKGRNTIKIVRIKRRPFSRSLVQYCESREMESTVGKSKEHDDEAISKTREKTECSEGKRFGALLHCEKRDSELGSTLVAKLREEETGISNETNSIYIDQNRHNRVNKFLENETKPIKNTDEVPPLRRDVAESQNTQAESVSSSVGNGKDALRLHTNEDIYTHSTDKAELNDQNSLSTVMTMPSIADAEIEASVKELDHRMSQSKETLNDLE